MKENYEPWLRMASGHIREAQRYLERVVADESMRYHAGIDRVYKDLTDSLSRIEKYAKDNRIELRRSMKT